MSRRSISDLTRTYEKKKTPPSTRLNLTLANSFDFPIEHTGISLGGILSWMVFESVSFVRLTHKRCVCRSSTRDHPIPVSAGDGQPSRRLTVRALSAIFMGGLALLEVFPAHEPESRRFAAPWLAGIIFDLELQMKTMTQQTKFATSNTT